MEVNLHALCTRTQRLNKGQAYSAYKQARADMKELYNVRANVEHLLDIPTGRESQRDTQKLRQ